MQIDLVEDDPDLSHVRGRKSSDEIWASVRVIEFDPDGSIRSIVEQPIRLAMHFNLLADAERVAACMAAHVEVLTEMFAEPDPPDVYNFPGDLMFVSELLLLRKSNSREQFSKALRAGTRLGTRLG